MTHFSATHLSRAVGVLTLLLLCLPLFLKKNKLHSKPPSLSKKIVGYSLFLLASMIAGFYGEQGLITTYLFIIFFNKTISESAGTRIVSALASTIAPCIIYGFQGFIDWAVVGALMSGTMLGATLGAQYALKKGDA